MFNADQLLLDVYRGVRDLETMKITAQHNTSLMCHSDGQQFVLRTTQTVGQQAGGVLAFETYAVARVANCWTMREILGIRLPRWGARVDTAQSLKQGGSKLDIRAFLGYDTHCFAWSCSMLFTNKCNCANAMCLARCSGTAAL